jgi:TonB family protein
VFGRSVDYRLVAFGVLSIATHLFIVAFGEGLYTRSSRNRVAWAQHAFTRPLFDDPIEVDLPILGPETIDGKLIELPPIVIPPSGGETVPRPDTQGAGNGGQTAAETAENLADRQDERSLTTAIPNRFDRSQVQRINSGRERASREDWRASREPMELTFLASGRTAQRHERREVAVHDPAMGARWSGQAAHAGGALGAPPVPAGVTEKPRPEGGTLQGAEDDTLGVGVRDGVPGKDARDQAAVALARPLVTQSTPSIPADTKDKPQDRVDSEQEVAPAPQSIVQATTAGGTAGQGTGGQTGPTTTPGSGGQTGAGSDARPNGDGRGPDLAQLARDARRNDYLRRVVARIRPHFSTKLMPKWAIAEGRGGLAIVSFVIQRDGSVTGVRVSRSSTIPEYDENCRQVILKAGPFDPLPPELGSSLPWSMPFTSQNPAVR